MAFVRIILNLTITVRQWNVGRPEQSLSGVVIAEDIVKYIR